MSKLFYTAMLVVAAVSAQAQVKIGANPTSLTSGANLQIEATDGTQSIFMKATGNVGIGTNAPTQRLHVDGGTGNAYVNVNSPLAQISGIVISDGTNGLDWQIQRDATSRNLNIFGNGFGGSVAYFAQTGFVGLGTTNPTQKLHIEGNSTNTYIRVNSALANGAGIVLSDATNGLDWQIQREATTRDLNIFSNAYNGSVAYFAQSGFIGIGTTIPSQKLHIEGNSTNTYMRINSSLANAAGIVLSDATNGLDWQIQRDATTRDLNIFGNGFGGSVAYFSQTGFIGIGTTSPSQKLHIEGNSTNAYIRVNASLANATGIVFSDATNGFDWQIQRDAASRDLNIFGNGFGGSVAYFSQNGRVGIGTTSPAYKLEVNGDINALGNVRASGVILTSDARLKTNITTLGSVMPQLMQLTGYTYNWKDSKMGTSLQYGVLAQEVEKVFPTMVEQTNDHKAVNYIELIPVLIQAIKEQQAEIEDLKLKIK